jgi:hypothetical protein
MNGELVMSSLHEPATIDSKYSNPTYIFVPANNTPMLVHESSNYQHWTGSLSYAYYQTGFFEITSNDLVWAASAAQLALDCQTVTPGLIVVTESKTGTKGTHMSVALYGVLPDKDYYSELYQAIACIGEAELTVKSIVWVEDSGRVWYPLNGVKLWHKLRHPHHEGVKDLVSDVLLANRGQHEDYGSLIDWTKELNK